MIKSMNVNRELSLDKLIGLVDRVDSLQKATVAELWVLGNNVISESKRCALLGKISLTKAKLYIELAKSSARPIPKMTGIHKIHIDGVKELKVG